MHAFREIVILLAIKERRLYRKTHPTFDLYCRDKWHLTAGWARQFFTELAVRNNLELATRVAILPETEIQTRPLKRLEPSQQVEAWEGAVAENGGK